MADSDTSTTPATGAEDTAADTTASPATGSDELGEAGKRAIEAERKARKDAEQSAKKLAAELDRLREQSMSDTERAIQQARRDAANEARQQLMQRLVTAEVRAAAAGRLADPDDAVRFLNLSDFTGDDGEIDSKAVAAAIGELVASKPYLAASPAAPKFTGTADQGPRGTADDADLGSLDMDAYRKARRQQS